MEQGVLALLENAINHINAIFENMLVHLTTTPEKFANGSPWGIVVDVNDALKGISYGLLLMFFLISFLKNTTDYKSITLQSVIMMIIRFLLVKGLIDFSVQILNFIVNISLGANDVILQSGSGALGNLSVPQDVLDAIDGVVSQEWWERIPSFFQSIPLAILALLGSLVVWICGILLVCYTMMRFFKVYILSAISVIPLSTFGGKETSQIGKHFLKSYFAVCMELCIITLAMIFFSAITSAGGVMIWESWSEGNGVYADYWDVTTNFIVQLVVQVVLLTVTVMGANKLIKEAIGV